jgi:hypothetical protein
MCALHRTPVYDYPDGPADSAIDYIPLLHGFDSLQRPEGVISHFWLWEVKWPTFCTCTKVVVYHQTAIDPTLVIHGRMSPTGVSVSSQQMINQ